MTLTRHTIRGVAEPLNPLTLLNCFRLCRASGTVARPPGRHNAIFTRCNATHRACRGLDKAAVCRMILRRKEPTPWRQAEGHTGCAATARRMGTRADLPEVSLCVTMSLMKEISLRELHRRTGAWVRSARRYGSILVRDRNTPVARLVPVADEPPVNLFERWRPLKKFSGPLNRPVKGRPIADIISDDRDR